MADPATLDALYDAAFTALASLGPSGDKSFRALVEFGGELSPETVSQAVSNRLPAALVALAGEDATERDVYASTDGEQVVTTQASLVVYVAVGAVRGAKPAHDGAGGTKGLFALCSEVIEALNGLHVPGLWGSGFVRYARTRPVFFRPGNTGAVCAYAVTFVAERIAEQRTTPLPAGTVPLEQIDADLELADASASSTAARPITTVRADALDD